MLPQETIGLSNIGIVGWVVDRETIDFIGLVRNDSVKYYPIKDECPPSGNLYTIPPKLIQDSHPTWLVAGEGEMQSCFLQSDWFGQHYLPVYQYPPAPFGFGNTCPDLLRFGGLWPPPSISSPPSC